ncbi:MAG TPA: RusA family crossover junction endodeoxyribonuclease [Bryobacteraceae bacterium]|jgi:Holliday junction resolvase RusA-like endonuclease
MNFPGPIVRIEIPGEPKGVGRAKSRAIPLTNKATGQPIIGKNGQPVYTSMNYTPSGTRTEAGVIRMYAEKAMAGQPLLQNCLSLRMTMFMSVPKSMSAKKRGLALSDPPTIRPGKRPDADNSSKFVDAMKGVVFRDDSQFTEWLVWKRYSDRPRVVIEIREVSL